ncbi:SH3 domain-containing protein [Streptomyces orinoci]|uniref:SH3 domain-containing protein n=1 Tax=Streptomyces orinoci TaxID=67339 RepID=A0ABV3K681_STRON|nr:SH3 domain-containing protein [Streptomyces orinoci]
MRRSATIGIAALLAGAGALVAAAPAGAAPAARSSAVTAVVVAPPKGKVVSREPLSVRERPTTSAKYLGALKPGSVIELSCKKHGQNVLGNDIWYLLAAKPGYVSARYVKNLAPVPLCKK